MGDPAAWTRVLAALEAVRVATRPRGARTVVVVVHPPGEPPADLPEERLGPICRQGGVERRCAAPRVEVRRLPSRPTCPRAGWLICPRSSCCPQGGAPWFSEVKG